MGYKPQSRKNSKLVIEIMVAGQPYGPISIDRQTILMQRL